MVPAQQERRELLRRGDRSRHARACTWRRWISSSTAMWTNCGRRGLGEVAALTNETARGQPLERARRGGEGETVALGEPGGRHRPACPEQAQRQAFESVGGVERPIYRDVRRADPRAGVRSRSRAPGLAAPPRARRSAPGRRRPRARRSPRRSGRRDRPGSPPARSRPARGDRAPSSELGLDRVDDLRPERARRH